MLLAALAVGGCSTGSPPITASESPNPARSLIATNSVAAPLSTERTSSPPVTSAIKIGPPKSRLIPDLSLPLDSTESRGSTDIEIWSSPLDTTGTASVLRVQLPIGKPLQGVGWCEETKNSKTGLIVWTWADKTEWMNVSVGRNYIEQGVTGPGSEITITRQNSTEGC